MYIVFFFSSRRRHTRYWRDWSSDVCSSDLYMNRVRLDPGLWEAREGVEEKLTKLPAGIGAAFERLGPRFKESVKAFWAPGLRSEERRVGKECRSRWSPYH